MKRQLLLLSGSTPHGYTYLQFAKKDIEELFKRNDVTKVLFVPYALRDHDGYTEKTRKVVEEQWNFKVDGIHRHKDPVSAVESAQAIFVGGGNTFLLLKTMYENGVVEAIRRRVLEDGVPYVGSSAGTNVATVSICTTNDMPVVYPPTFDALGLVPFNINPHYVEPVPDVNFQGETRDERIAEFLEVHSNGPVLGLREGSILEVRGDGATLKGFNGAKLFTAQQEPKVINVGDDLSYLLKV